MSEHGAPLLSVRGLTKRFGSVVASDGVDLDLHEGGTHALIGPNGAGKTSFVAQLAGHVRPDAGRIAFDGHDITDAAVHDRVRRGLARSFQITRLFMGFSVLDNVALAVQARSGSSFSFWRPVERERALVDEARAVLDEVQLAHRADAIAAELSHGEQRALEVGVALATRPRVLLLDEPMAGTGPEDGARMVALIERLSSKLAILLVEHDMEAVFRLADTVSVLVDGRLVASGAPQDVRKHPAVIDAYLGEEAAW